eukprot:COSAG01_NODE_35017_length_538_cov_1.389522_1_plen_44_part_10
MWCTWCSIALHYACVMLGLEIRTGCAGGKANARKDIVATRALKG